MNSTNNQPPHHDEGLPPTTASSNQSGSNDFVKKLFQMLQEDSYKDVVKWTKNGDSFVVLNTNEFTKEVLPRHFKHSNFASFVRQLNKYDFHKVKVPNEEKQYYEYGEDAWEFKHPDFRINDRESLENIKRKGPSSKKNAVAANDNWGNMTQNFVQVQFLKDEIESLGSENKSLNQEINVLKTKYKALIDNIVSVKHFNERYYRSMGVLLNCLAQAGIKLPPLDFPNPNLMDIQQPPINQQPINQPHHQKSHSNSLTHISPPIPSPNPNTSGLQPSLPQARFDQSYMTRHTLPGAMQNLSQHAVPAPTSDTVTPKDASPQQLSKSVESPITSNTQSQEPQRNSITASSPDMGITNLSNPKFHVLLVEDDNVCIQLCRKFLVKYGCQVTVVTDGLNAISTVENTKYDLVLMDIVMPNLDGATATSVIRSFDTKTPIIAMTGNIEDNDLVTYLQNGMSDILAKPFTKDDLYSILSKHLLTSELKTEDPVLQGVIKNQIIEQGQYAPRMPPQHLNNEGDPMVKKQRLQ